MPVNLFAQEEETAIATYHMHYNQAMRFVKLSLYAEGISELGRAIEVAKQNNFEEQYFQASIDLAETLRKTEDFSRGLKILHALGTTNSHPLQEVRRLGRLAAIYHERGFPNTSHQYDSIMIFLEPAMTLAETHNFELELASLKNEWGYLIRGTFGSEKGIPIQQEAARLFLKNGDNQNYVGAMTKILEHYVYEQVNIQKADSISPILIKEVEGTNWYTAKSQLYQVVANHALYNKGDSLTHFIWIAKSLENHVKNSKAVHSNQLDNLRVIHETEEFQREAENTAQALTRQEERNKELALYLSVLAAMILSMIFLFYRERKTKRAKAIVNQQLQIANEKYQMLMVESNHRIKNNLQMIISMLEYTGKDVNPSNTRALKRMSGKIHTISALHKHLYSDAHNEKVDLGTYFKEIISLYLQLSPDNLEVFEHFDTIDIPNERLVYFGLIFNEMLSNTVEHNAHDVKQVHISAIRREDSFTFEYRDDSSHGNDRTERTGSLLIRQLISRIGGQNFQFDPNIGQYQFQFNA
ncbi:MAG: sensor histidine kinase [Roseivirga sp.]|nr:sensor histidine kinase [Roseivirga sp.]